MLGTAPVFVGSRLQLLQRPGAGATALKHHPRTGEWRTQIMCDVIADACKGMDESFHLVEHAIDDHRKFGEGIVGVPMRESFAQVAGDDALNALVDLYNTPTGTAAQCQTDRKAKKQSGNETKRERLTNNSCNLTDFVDVSSDHQHVARR